MHLKQLKQEYIQGIYQSKALLVKEEPFTLQSGKKSHIYLNHRNFLSQWHYIALVANIYHQLANEIDSEFVLGAVDSIMSPILVGAMCTMYKKNYVVVKKMPLKHGTQEYIYGEMRSNTVLIDDMTSTGDTLLDAAEKIRLTGGKVEYAIISAYREDTAIHNLKSQGIKLLSIVSFEEIIDHLKPSFSPMELNIINQSQLIFE